MPQTKYVTYKDFTKGDWGDIGEYRAPEGTYSGVNVVLYDNGMLGPRAGLHLNEPTSGSLGQGRVFNMSHIGAIGKPLMLVVDDNIFSTTQNSINLGTVASVASLNAVPTDTVVSTWYDPNGDVYITSPFDGVYYINWTTNAIANIQDSAVDVPGTQSVYLCRDRLYLIGDSVTGLGQRVYYSAAADFTNFDDSNYFEVGYYNTTRAAIESQNSLMFSTLESVNTLGSGVGWYSLVGATPQGDLRRVNTQIGAIGQTEVVNAEGGNVYFFTGWSTAETDNPYLVQTNGAKFDENTYHHLRLEGTNRFGYYNAPDRSLMYVARGGSTHLMRVNDAWSYVSFEVDVSGPLCTNSAGDAFLLAYGETGEDVKVYECLSSPQKPGSADGQQNPGDDSNTPINAFFFLPAFQSDVKEMRVRRVIVDFKKWNTVHDDTNNEFTVNLRTWGQYNLPTGSADGINLETAEFSENQSLSATDGTMDRYVMRCGNQGKAAGFQVYITGIKGCAFESITVEYDEDDSQTGRTL